MCSGKKALPAVIRDSYSYAFLQCKSGKTFIAVICNKSLAARIHKLSSVPAPGLGRVLTTPDPDLLASPFVSDTSDTSPRNKSSHIRWSLAAIRQLLPFHIFNLTFLRAERQVKLSASDPLLLTRRQVTESEGSLRDRSLPPISPHSYPQYDPHCTKAQNRSPSFPSCTCRFRCALGVLY